MSKSARRFVILICVLAAALITVLFFINYARNSEFRTAAAWHKAHGNVFLVDGHKLVLPQDWWEKGEGQDGKLFAVKASKDLTHLSQSAITVDRKGVEESKKSEEEIRKSLESFVNNDKETGNDVTQSSLVIVSAVSTNMYCLKTLLERKDLELRCDVVGTPIVIKSIGPPESEKEIESVLSTFN
jgi:hypothetical protein